MQLLCKVASPFADVSCPVCGQGFMVYWTRTRALERREQQLSLQISLRTQHGALSTADAHAPAFHLPDIPIASPQTFHDPHPSGAVPVYS